MGVVLVVAVGDCWTDENAAWAVLQTRSDGHLSALEVVVNCWPADCLMAADAVVLGYDLLDVDDFVGDAQLVQAQSFPNASVVSAQRRCVAAVLNVASAASVVLPFLQGCSATSYVLLRGHSVYRLLHRSNIGMVPLLCAVSHVSSSSISV